MKTRSASSGDRQLEKFTGRIFLGARHKIFVANRRRLASLYVGLVWNLVLRVDDHSSCFQNSVKKLSHIFLKVQFNPDKLIDEICLISSVVDVRKVVEELIVARNRRRL